MATDARHRNRRSVDFTEAKSLGQNDTHKSKSQPSVLPQISQRNDRQTKVLPDATHNSPGTQSSPTLPSMNTTQGAAPSRPATASPESTKKESATMPPAQMKRHKSIMQVSHRRKPGDVVLEKERTIELMIKYQMGQCELRKLKAAFNYIDLDRSGLIDYDEFFEFIDEGRTPFSESLFKMIDADESGSIDFEEFVHALTTYCMFTREEILKFAFQTFDDDESGTIDEMEFAKLANMVNDGKPLFPGNYKKALREFDKNNDGVIDFDEFQSLNKRYPMVLFPCFRLQDRMQKATLGDKHWLKIHERYCDLLRDEQYRRKHAGAAPPVSTTTKLKLLFGIGTFEVYQPE